MNFMEAGNNEKNYCNHFNVVHFHINNKHVSKNK